MSRPDKAMLDELIDMQEKVERPVNVGTIGHIDHSKTSLTAAIIAVCGGPMGNIGHTVMTKPYGKPTYTSICKSINEPSLCEKQTKSKRGKFKRRSK